MLRRTALVALSSTLLKGHLLPPATILLRFDSRGPSLSRPCSHSRFMSAPAQRSSGDCIRSPKCILQLCQLRLDRSRWMNHYALTLPPQQQRPCWGAWAQFVGPSVFQFVERSLALLTFFLPVRAVTVRMNLYRLPQGIAYMSAAARGIAAASSVHCSIQLRLRILNHLASRNRER